MTRDELKKRVFAAIDRRAAEIVALGERIRRHPEMGFKEAKTAGLVQETLGRLGMTPRTGLAMTGVRAEARGRGGDGPTFALIGELDGLRVTGHPEADPATGVAHACGHNAQVAGMLGAAMGLVDAGALEHLAGRVVFFGVPAEEGGDIEWRQEQIRAGRLEFPCGKQELMRLGHFDDVDLAMMIHTNWRAEDGKAGVPASNNGRVGKTARLYAAQIALAGINAVRETFRDEDSIRVHPILTHGGSQVNVIPGEARLEMYVRGKTPEGVADASRRVDRALRAGALALGAQVEIDTLPGPMPLRCDRTMARLFETTARGLVGPEHYRDIPHRSGSTDMGDLSQVMPVLHPYMGGARGPGHSADFAIVDPDLGYVQPAKALAAMAVDLLADGAAGAREVLAGPRPPMTRDGYLAFQRGIARRERFDGGDPT